MPDPYPIDPNTDGNSIDFATIVAALADDLEIVGDRADYHPTEGRVVEETPSGNRWVGTGDQWLSLDTTVGLAATLFTGGSTVHVQRGAPTTDDLAAGERMVYTSDGSDGNAAGDLVSARNDSGAIVSQVIAAAADDA
ncbi:hypothetical protein NDI85_21175 [Halomicroarcula sp. S1AR25-4]|uniref:hypothetical protein n=1 Tax=Haloarcula sp. S1AR25-4 TaxID=2950538 RepID=UPI0028758654|nr:hypothetical protein [Halomicroarcula sp. S1AR25-4]MDS0280300.1 hypothetical protein [Halomicroarcula sp. S1AR25-4]